MSRPTEDRGKCRCGACGASFGRLSTFELHRYGPYNERRCLTRTAMLEQGFTVDTHGYWRAPPSLNADGTVKASPWAKPKPSPNPYSPTDSIDSPQPPLE